MTASTLDDIDLSSHDAFRDAVPHDWFRRLRHEAPVFFNPEPDGPGFYAVTRYDDIRTVHRTPEVFSSEIGGTSLEDLDADQIEARRSMIDTDPPRHRELRMIVAKRFIPPAIAAWEDAVRVVTDRVLDIALEKGEFDFVEEIASEVPMSVFAEILGVPQSERRYVIDLGDRILGNADPEFAAAAPTDDAHRLLPFSSPAAKELIDFGRRMADLRRANPREDIVTQLALSGLSQREFDVFFVLLATAGNETTRHTISHGLLALLEHPDELERLRGGDEALLRTATDEMLRWATPVHHFRRTTTQATELAGTAIPAGAKVVTWFCSGNRDETVFADPDRFDVGRSPNKHMAFGPGGIHHCIGAHLARMEVRLVFEHLLERVSAFELTAPPERLRSNFFNGIKRMPIRVTAA